MVRRTLICLLLSAGAFAQAPFQPLDLSGNSAVLDQGGVLAEGTPQDIAGNEAVQAAYLGKAA